MRSVFDLAPSAEPATAPGGVVATELAGPAGPPAATVLSLGIGPRLVGVAGLACGLWLAVGWALGWIA